MVVTIDLGIDLDRARRDTPGIDHVAHLNNAGGALRPSVVTDTVVAHLRREAEIGPYEAEAESEARVAGVYESVARLIGAQPDEIALVQSATAAWNVAFASIPLNPASASSPRAPSTSATRSRSCRRASAPVRPSR